MKNMLAVVARKIASSSMNKKWTIWYREVGQRKSRSISKEANEELFEFIRDTFKKGGSVTDIKHNNRNISAHDTLEIVRMCRLQITAL
jgi:hypothetical protein